MRNLWLIAIGIALIGSTVSCEKTKSEVQKVRAMEISDVDLGKLEDNTYYGDFTYNNFTYKVSVDIENNIIKDIKVLTNRRSEYTLKAEGVLERIIEKQTPNVDVISGATTTSKAFMKAVENALTVE
jgi:uncharacterized protein with FMN-binding domain